MNTSSQKRKNEDDRRLKQLIPSYSFDYSDKALSFKTSGSSGGAVHHYTLVIDEKYSLCAVSNCSAIKIMILPVGLARRIANL